MEADIIILDDLPNEVAEEFDLPSYKEPGRILFKYDPTGYWYDEGVEIIDYDNDKATFWLNESSFMDYTISNMIDLELDGYYVLEGVIGHSWRDYWGEYDEEWSFEFCRRATEEEIRTEALEDK
jgi:hypothetical protein